jgi:hypothetical protein
MFAVPTRANAVVVMGRMRIVGGAAAETNSTLTSAEGVAGIGGDPLATDGSTITVMSDTFHMIST